MNRSIMTINGYFFLSILLLIFVAGGLVGISFTEDYYKRDIIKHGYAEYNSTNGVWQWKPVIDTPSNFRIQE